MYLAESFLVSMLCGPGLMGVPLVHNRPVAAETRRLEGPATPLFDGRIQADKAHLRAEFAMSSPAAGGRDDRRQLKTEPHSSSPTRQEIRRDQSHERSSLGERTPRFVSLEAREKA